RVARWFALARRPFGLASIGAADKPVANDVSIQSRLGNIVETWRWRSTPGHDSAGRSLESAASPVWAVNGNVHGLRVESLADWPSPPRRTPRTEPADPANAALFQRSPDARGR